MRFCLYPDFWRWLRLFSSLSWRKFCRRLSCGLAWPSQKNHDQSHKEVQNLQRKLSVDIKNARIQLLMFQRNVKYSEMLFPETKTESKTKRTLDALTSSLAIPSSSSVVSVSVFPFSFWEISDSCLSLASGSESPFRFQNKVTFFERSNVKILKIGK
jgi:hypothetical protein